jgi:Leucine-rich repeat (LRR) protein
MRDPDDLAAEPLWVRRAQAHEKGRARLSALLAAVGKGKDVDLSAIGPALGSAAESFASLAATEIHSLDLSRNGLRFLPIRGVTFPTLRRLDLSRNALTSFYGIAKAAPAIEELCLHDNSLSDFSLLDQMPALRRLDLRANRLVSQDRTLCNLRGAPSLEELDLSGNPRLTLGLSLSSLRKLRRVVLDASISLRDQLAVFEASPSCELLLRDDDGALRGVAADEVRSEREAERTLAERAREAATRERAEPASRSYRCRLSFARAADFSAFPRACERLALSPLPAQGECFPHAGTGPYDEVHVSRGAGCVLQVGPQEGHEKEMGVYRTTRTLSVGLAGLALTFERSDLGADDHIDVDVRTSLARPDEARALAVLASTLEGPREPTLHAEKLSPPADFADRLCAGAEQGALIATHTSAGTVDWEAALSRPAPRPVERADLSFDELEMLPRALARFTHIKRLDASANLLARIDPWLEHLALLEHLTLDHNLIDSLDELPPLPSLRILSLRGNAIEALPGSLARAFPRLVVLDVRQNPVRYLSDELGALDHLALVHVDQATVPRETLARWKAALPLCFKE